MRPGSVLARVRVTPDSKVAMVEERNLPQLTAECRAAGCDPAKQLANIHTHAVLGAEPAGGRAVPAAPLRQDRGLLQRVGGQGGGQDRAGGPAQAVHHGPARGHGARQGGLHAHRHDCSDPLAPGQQASAGHI